MNTQQKQTTNQSTRSTEQSEGGVTAYIILYNKPFEILEAT
jgi:hypothetical protein